MKNIVLLHGWALKINSGWRPFIQLMEAKGFRVYFPQIPGLSGKNLDKTWDLYTYADWHKQYINKNKIRDFCLLGHSFGGSIAITYTSQVKNQAKGLILISSSGIRKKSLPKKIINKITKIFKIFFLIYPICLLKDLVRKLWYRILGSGDYLQTDGFSSKTFIKIINFDLTPLLIKISCPTLILWGAEDKDTPLKEGQIMHDKIKNSQLHVFANASHGLPFQKKNELIEKITSFCEKI